MTALFKMNVSTIIFNDDNEVLIQKRSSDEDIFPGLWGIPGGTVEMSDPSILDALRREVKEEVDIEIDSIFLYRENIRAKELYSVSYLVFIATYVSGEPKALDGTDKVMWVGKSDLGNYEFTPTTKEAIIEAFAWKKSQSILNISL